MDLAAFLAETVRLIVTRDPDLMEIVALTFRVSGVALAFSSLVGIPLGAFLGLKRFTGRRLVISLLYTGMGFPPVVIGLVVYMLLSVVAPSGHTGRHCAALVHPGGDDPGSDDYLFPAGGGVHYGGGHGRGSQLRRAVVALGAQEARRRGRSARGSHWCHRLGHCGFREHHLRGGSCDAGGRQYHKTRVLTTAIVLETRKGNFELASSLGLILLVLSFIVNLAMMLLQGRSFDE